MKEYPKIHLNEAFMLVRIGMDKTWKFGGEQPCTISGKELAEVCGISPAVLGSTWTKFQGELYDGLGFQVERRYSTDLGAVAYHFKG